MGDLLTSANSANPTLQAFFLHLSGVKFWLEEMVIGKISQRF